jgi:hypothetical protein
MSTPYRPANWANGPAMVALIVTESSLDPTYSGDLNSGANVARLYVFQAVFELEHEQTLEATKHPVQTGTDITSHAYILPAKLTMSIGMSDVMDAYASGAASSTASLSVSNAATPSTVTPFTGPSKSQSINAYQQVLAMQAARQVLTIVTRLRTYTNMLVVSVSPKEDYKTITGLRMRVAFEQILTGSVTSNPISARTDATQNTTLGAVNPSPVPVSTQNQFQIPQLGLGAGGAASPFDVQTGAMSSPMPPTVDIPGAGDYASVSGQQALPQ